LKLKGIIKKKDEMKEARDLSIEDRTYVCIGTYANGKFAPWVMTFGPDYKSVTMWDVIKHETYVL